jgi:ABC-2 type transport system permease protein
MNALWTLARKDLLLLARDRMSMFWMLGFPLIFAALFGSIFGGSGPGKSNPLRVAVVAEGLNAAGRAFVARLDASDALEVEELPRAEAVDAVRLGRKIAYLDIRRMPADGFAMFGGDTPEIEVGIDPSRQAEQGFLKGLLMEASFAGLREVFADPEQGRAQARRMGERVRAAEDLPAAQKLILTTFFGALDSFLGQVDFGAGEGGAAAAIEPRIETVAVARERSGPPNAYSVSFPQSILWAILGAAAGFAITLVRERSSGTMVRLLSAPISRSAVLAGKALACFLTICAVVAVLTAVGWLGFGVQVGSVALLALGTASAGACFAGIAMLLSALGRTEQAVGGLAWGVLIVLAMLGGGMVPQIAMPAWMLSAGAISPARWTVQALEGAIWRGFTLGEMLLPCAVLLGFGALAFAVGAGRLRRESS